MWTHPQSDREKENVHTKRWGDLNPLTEKLRVVNAPVIENFWGKGVERVVIMT